MSEPLRFTVYGEAQGKGSMRAFMPKGSKYPVMTSTNKSLKGWESAVAAAARSRATGQLLCGPLSLKVTFYLSRPKSLPKKFIDHVRRPDLDKLIRGATDALTKVVWADDSQLVTITAHKKYVEQQAETPRAEFEIVDLVPGLFPSEIGF